MELSGSGLVARRRPPAAPAEIRSRAYTRSDPAWLAEHDAIFRDAQRPLTHCVQADAPLMRAATMAPSRCWPRPGFPAERLMGLGSDVASSAASRTLRSA